MSACIEVLWQVLWIMEENVFFAELFGFILPLPIFFRFSNSSYIYWLDAGRQSVTTDRFFFLFRAVRC